MLPLTRPSNIARAACFTHAAIPRMHVDREQLLGHVEFGYCLFGGTSDPSVSEHDVNLTVRIDRCLNEVFDLFFVCHVAVNVGAPVSANGRCHSIHQIVLDVCDYHHTRALLRKDTRRCFADATGTSCDNGYFGC
ncbi:hypothetical protein GLYMA_04G003401v4 [Glycine max]|nr:hypothetical protein GYH30_008496 [Glycine max]KRH60694.2 hypothetical protein GLYMA_04G003401v4 [Glycine max]